MRVNVCGLQLCANRNIYTYAFYRLPISFLSTAKTFCDEFGRHVCMLRVIYLEKKNPVLSSIYGKIFRSILYLFSLWD